MKRYRLILCFQFVVLAAPGQKVEMVKNNGSVTFRADNKNLLSYQYQTVYPPAGQDTNYKRSGFIHPVCTPDGQMLTRIQPPDHYHHYGIWNPWTHTKLPMILCCRFIAMVRSIIT